MKVLICLFAVLVGANAGFIANGGLYSSGLISAPVSYVQPAVQTVQVVKQPVITSTVYSSPAHVYHSTPIVSAPVVSSQIVSAPIVSAPVVSSVPVVSTSYGINGGLRYANSYGLGGHTKVVNIVSGGVWKQ